MKIIRSINEMRALSTEWRCAQASVGFVPTMGALHEGHLSLVRASKEENQQVVVSIFVNPLQFLPGEDFAGYPRNEEHDLQLLKKAGVDCIFLPTVEEIYPQEPLLKFSCPSLTNVLCGLSRPGHFEGVMMVVSKLLNIVQPQQVYFGQKDYQQCLVVKNLITDLAFNIDFRMLPIVREAHGLALSSRNAYLSLSEKNEAVLLNVALQKAQAMVDAGENAVEKLLTAMRTVLQEGQLLKIDYLEILTADTLQKVELLTKGRYVVAVAAYFGKMRLIDNLLIDVS